VNNPMPKQMTANECKLALHTLDNRLGMLRGYWVEAKDAEEKAKWMDVIDSALAERFEVMKHRDRLNLTKEFKKE